jgi:M6 family metalloprotease-like protein
VRAVFVLFAVLSASVARADYMDHFKVREDVGVHKAPYLGPTELLVMPVEVAGHPALPMAEINDFFANAFPHYYETVSFGRYTPHVTVGPVVHYAMCPVPFPNCSVARGDITAFSAGIQMIHDVVANEADAGVDFSKLDVNGRNGVSDGWADGVLLLTNIDFGGIAFPFGYFNQGDNLNGGMGGPLISNGVKVTHVAIAGDSSYLTLVHEFGHVLGLTDLYDENQNYAGLQFAVMGAWLYDDKIPLHDAETRYRLRWTNWHQVQGTQHVVIGSAEETGEVWRLGTGDEYFLIENRGPGGQYDQAFTERGLAVYHVDRTLKQLSGAEGTFVDRILNCVNCDPWHPYIMNVQSNGRFDLQNNKPLNYDDDLFRDGDSLEADPSGVAIGPDHQVPSTNWYDGGQSGLAIRDIKVLDDAGIEVTLVAPETGQCGETLCSDGGWGCEEVTCETPPGAGGKGCGCGEAGYAPLLLAALGALIRRGRRAAAA